MLDYSATGKAKLSTWLCKKKFIKMLPNEQEQKTFTVVHFHLVFLLLFVCWFLGAVLLMAEIIITRKSKKVKVVEGKFEEVIEIR